MSSFSTSQRNICFSVTLFSFLFLGSATFAGEISPPSIASAGPKTVTALGRLEPEGRVTHLTAPPALEGVRLRKLLVHEGDLVHKGQVVALLDNHDRLEAAVNVAKEQVKEAEADLKRIKAGAKSGDLRAQQAAILRITGELGVAEREEKRYQQLYHEGAISVSDYEKKRISADSLGEELRQAKATLDSIAEVRPVDVDLAKAKLETSRAALKLAYANLEISQVLSPRDGRVLRVHSKEGELIGPEGILNLGDTDQMEVVAEVYQNDIQKIRLGQIAEITSDAFTHPLHGIVNRIGLQIGKQNIIGTDPVASVDARVVEVRIKLDPEDSRIVSGLTNMQVTVQIRLAKDTYAQVAKH